MEGYSFLLEWLKSRIRYWEQVGEECRYLHSEFRAQREIEIKKQDLWGPNQELIVNKRA